MLYSSLSPTSPGKRSHESLRLCVNYIDYWITSGYRFHLVWWVLLLSLNPSLCRSDSSAGVCVSHLSYKQDFFLKRTIFRQYSTKRITRSYVIQQKNAKRATRWKCLQLQTPSLNFNIPVTMPTFFYNADCLNSITITSCFCRFKPFPVHYSKTDRLILRSKVACCRSPSAAFTGPNRMPEFGALCPGCQITSWYCFSVNSVINSEIKQITVSTLTFSEKAAVCISSDKTQQQNVSHVNPPFPFFPKHTPVSPTDGEKMKKY